MSAHRLGLHLARLISRGRVSVVSGWTLADHYLTIVPYWRTLRAGLIGKPGCAYRPIARRAASLSTRAVGRQDAAGGQRRGAERGTSWLTASWGRLLLPETPWGPGWWVGALLRVQPSSGEWAWSDKQADRTAYTALRLVPPPQPAGHITRPLSAATTPSCCLGRDSNKRFMCIDPLHSPLTTVPQHEPSSLRQLFQVPIDCYLLTSHPPHPFVITITHGDIFPWVQLGATPHLVLQGREIRSGVISNLLPWLPGARAWLPRTHQGPPPVIPLASNLHILSIPS